MYVRPFPEAHVSIIKVTCPITQESFEINWENFCSDLQTSIGYQDYIDVEYNFKCPICHKNHKITLK